MTFLDCLVQFAMFLPFSFLIITGFVYTSFKNKEIIVNGEDNK